VEYGCTRARGADISRGNAKNSERWGAHGLDGKERTRERNAGAVERNENRMKTHDRCGKERKCNERETNEERCTTARVRSTRI